MRSFDLTWLSFVTNAYVAFTNILVIIILNIVITVNSNFIGISEWCSTRCTNIIIITKINFFRIFVCFSSFLLRITRVLDSKHRTKGFRLRINHRQNLLHVNFLWVAWIKRCCSNLEILRNIRRIAKHFSNFFNYFFIRCKPWQLFRIWKDSEAWSHVAERVCKLWNRKPLRIITQL